MVEKFLQMNKLSFSVGADLDFILTLNVPFTYKPQFKSPFYGIVLFDRLVITLGCQLLSCLFDERETISCEARKKIGNV